MGSKWLNSIEKLARPWVTERRLVVKPSMASRGASASMLSLVALVSEPWMMPPRCETRLMASPRNSFGTTMSTFMPAISQAKSRSKGGGLVKTVEGNILVGPTATEAPGREEYATSSPELRELNKHFKINKRLSPSMAITYFAGVRPCTYEEDFIVERSAGVRNLVHAAGIQSPGLASAPAIAAEVARLALEALSETEKVSPKAVFIARREARPELRRLPLEERAALIGKNPAYGRIVCRCEEVSEGEIRDALRSSVPATTLDAVKRRVRPGMGRCHGGFCTPRVMEIISDELKIPLWEITKKGPGSRIALGETKTRGQRP